MKTLRLVLALSLTPTLGALGGAGPGPWANGTYYPGNLDGKYQAAVSGENTAGVLGFALTDGSPVFRQTTQQQGSTTNTTPTLGSTEQRLSLDSSVNYYAIFVNGRTYTGNTVASVSYPNSTVTGVLQGTASATNTTTNNQLVSQLLTNIGSVTLTNVSNSISVVSQLFTNTTFTNQTTLVTNNGVVTETNVFFTNTTVQTVFITNTNTVNLPPTVVNTTNLQTEFITNQTTTALVVATGVSGAFSAKIKSNQGVFTFKGDGSLTAPGPVISNTQTDSTLSFNVNGLRVSFSGASTIPTTTTGTTGAAQ
jgi:hypothetical protein